MDEGIFMFHKSSLIAALLLAGFGLAEQNPASQHFAQQSSQSRNSNVLAPIPAARAADSYAIYSLLMPGASADTISPRQIHHWVIDSTTVNIIDMNPAVPPNGQLKAPPENIHDFNEAVHDYNVRRYQRFLLDASGFHPRLDLPLLDEKQVNALRQSHPIDTGIAFFSEVYFNDAQTAALVYMNDWCANLCAAGQWVYLEKHNGHWVRRSGIIANGA
jgi:hypothetical protein